MATEQQAGDPPLYPYTVNIVPCTPTPFGYVDSHSIKLDAILEQLKEINISLKETNSLLRRKL